MRTLALLVLVPLSIACGDPDVMPAVDAGELAADAGPTPSGPCGADGLCGAARCIVDRAAAGTDLAPLPLVCGAPGAGAADGAECVLGSECARGLCVVAGTCRAPCRDDADCASDEWCAATYARTGAESLQPVSVCIPVFSGEGATVTRMPAIGSLRGQAGMLDDVDLPATPASSLVALVPAEDTSDPFFVRVTTREPEPRVLFDFDAVTATSGAPIQGVNPGTGVLTLQLPNGPLSAFAGAPLRASLESTAPTSLELRVLTREAARTTLDVHVFVAGVSDIAASAPLPADVTAAIEGFRTAYAAAGIELGTIRVHDIVGGLRDRFARIEGGIADLDLRALFRLSAGAIGPGVSWFFVRDIGGGQALAQSGGIPGPMGMHGTSSSGIAFALDTVRPQSRLDLVLIHETGHYLGLFHTGELRGFVIEPLSDTPECRLDRDANRDGLLSSAECAGAGAENPMFWDVRGRDPFSAQQIEVLRRALSLR